MTSPGLITVRGQHAGQTLIKDIVPGYSCALTDGKNITTILTEMLAYQEVESVVLGGVAPELDVVHAITIPWSTIWDACKEVQKVVGGYLYIDVNPDDHLERRLWLANTTGSPAGKQIRLGKNLTGVRHLTDYHDYANRLYPLGNSDLLLSTKSYTRADFIAEVESAGGYHYRFLPDYQAYDDWTGLGGTLPAGMTIEKPTGAWINATSHDTGPKWYYPEYTHDGNDASVGFYGYVGDAWHFMEWTTWLTLTFPATAATAVRFPLVPLSPAAATIQVDIYYGGAWHNIYNLAELGFNFKIVTFSQQTVTGVRFRAFKGYNPGPGYDSCIVSEISLWDTTGYTNDNAHWTQGANERCIRCADANYVENVGYVISYNHAPYLINLPGAGTTRPDVYSAQESFDTSDVDELMARGKVRLAELGEALISVDVDMIDLSVEAGREYEELDVGDLVQVIDEGLGISEKAIAVSLEKPDLLHPEQIKVEIATKVKTILDII